MKDYLKILALVTEIDSHLKHQTRHYYANGRMLRHLDEVVRAIIEGTLKVKNVN